MADIRIFSYLPNPRLYKATVASRLNGVDIEIRGAKPGELKDWLWDFDAHPLTETERDNPQTLRIAKKGFSGGIHKTDAFLAAQPFGNVPAAFSGDGKIGIFESNSILRIVARLGEAKCPLYGGNAFEATRIDSFLDASLNFAVESQRYLFGFGDLDRLAAVHGPMSDAFDTYLTAIDRALAASPYIAGDSLSIADIAFACEVTLFALERHEKDKLAKRDLLPIFDSVAAECERARSHLQNLLHHEAFLPDLTVYFNEMTMKKAFG
ncbi:MAG: glutathione S-transferase family protein [Pseudomonadota bacterium]